MIRPKRPLVLGTPARARLGQICQQCAINLAYGGKAGPARAREGGGEHNVFCRIQIFFLFFTKFI